MNVKQALEKQIVSSYPLTEDQLKELHDRDPGDMDSGLTEDRREEIMAYWRSHPRTYHSGKKMEVGDMILYAVEELPNCGRIIDIGSSELDFYNNNYEVVEEKWDDSVLPIIRKKVFTR